MYCKVARASRGMLDVILSEFDVELIDFKDFDHFQDIDKNRDFNRKPLIKFYRNYYRCLLCYI